MKLALILFPLLVAAVSGLEDEKRFILDSFNLESLLPHKTITTVVDAIVGVVGSDATESACESTCDGFASMYITSFGSHLVCPPMCQNFQHYVQKYGTGK